MNGKVLVVDDDRDLCALVNTVLTKRQHEVACVTSGADAIRRVDEEGFDVVLTDLCLGDFNGLDLCRHVVDRRPDTPVVVMTGFGSMDSAIGALRVGAYDFITKPVDMGTLVAAISRAVQHRRLSIELRRLREEVSEPPPLPPMIGSSPAMKEVYDLVDRVGPSDANVLITGESGTGKELVARAIHDRSARANGPFVAINCAAMPATLLESELFGHLRGAFTDAKKARDGLFLQANGGTLFLDEIGDMPVELQPKILRALQERAVRPVGGDHDVPFDARIVSATNRDLDAAVELGAFREDLYYRVNVVSIPLPPLRRRGNDVLVLAHCFVVRYAERAGKPIKGISAPAAEILRDHPWPGNVRELENCVERAVTLARYDELVVDDLPARMRDRVRPRADFDVGSADELVTLAELERRYVGRVLESVGGNKTVAARILGVDRRTLYRKLERAQDPDESVES